MEESMTLWWARLETRFSGVNHVSLSAMFLSQFGDLRNKHPITFDPWIFSESCILTFLKEDSHRNIHKYQPQIRNPTTPCRLFEWFQLWGRYSPISHQTLERRWARNVGLHNTGTGRPGNPSWGSAAFHWSPDLQLVADWSLTAKGLVILALKSQKERNFLLKLESRVPEMVCHTVTLDGLQ